MAYEYVAKAYGLDFKPRARVWHAVIKKAGTVARENKSQSHYVMVKFDGRGFSVPCHPQELSPMIRASNE